MHKPVGEYTFDYRNFRALKSYIERVGAEQVNFRRFLVKEYGDDQRRYYRVAATIKIIDGEIECEEAEYAPSSEEAEAIKAELAKVEWPRSIPAGLAEVKELAASGAITGELYVFVDGSRKKVIMCQERRENEQDPSKKIFIPWTMFMAGGHSPFWREMEPDGALPFWKPPAFRNKAKVMIHEGAGAAKYCDDLVNDPERKAELRAHPWGEELADFEHWGASGGALAIHRGDFNELRRFVEKLEGMTVVYSCDNDKPGVKAGQSFSKMWAKGLIMLQWDRRFFTGWDLADKVPQEAAGSTMWSFAEPATWATKEVGKTSHGRPLYALNDVFASEWVHVIKPEFYINESFPMLVYDQKQFDHHCASFADGGARVSALLNSYYPGRVATINYRPDLKPGRHTTDEGVKFFNVHVPRRWQPFKKAPDVGPFLDFLTRVFPNGTERKGVMKWSATLISRPQIKMAYGLLLISETHGVGKTTLADILAEILGMHNVSYVSEHQIIGRFNDWAEKRLIICEEIYAGHSAVAYNKLKTFITDKRVQIEKKNIQTYYIDNFSHIIACSNDLKALKLDNSDRRWFVPEVTELKYGVEDYWSGLRHWLDQEDGYRKIVWWAEQFLKEERQVMPGEEAPWTKTKSAVIESFRSDMIDMVSGIMMFIKNIYKTNGEIEINIDVDPIGQIAKLVALAKAGRPFLFFDVDVVETIKQRFPGERRPEKALAVRKLTKELGLKVADRDHRMNLLNWRPYGSYGISTEQEMANSATQLLKGKNPQRERVEELISFSELALELLGPVSM
jgi:uncharacterized protein DUF5906